MSIRFDAVCGIDPLLRPQAFTFSKPKTVLTELAIVNITGGIGGVVDEGPRNHFMQVSLA